jgi:L-rhamnose-H+ transport protein
MVIGIAISAWAGLEREKHSPNDAIVSPHRGKAYWVALSVALLCGLMAPMLNYAFAFGDSIAQNAVRHGTAPEAAPYAIWPVALFGGLIPNLGYALALLTKNRSWMFFRESIFPDLWLASSMGILWMGALAIYSVSSVLLGTLGTSVGWALFQIFMILTANCAGVLSGEWRTALPAARRHLWTGLGLLVIASAVIAAGNR